MAYGLASIAGLAASIGVGLLFVTAGADKLRHRRLLPGVIANYRLLPEAFVAPAARALPLAEMLIGGALIAGEPLFAPPAAMLLLALFAAAMALNIQRGRRNIDCGCGHAGLRQTIGWPLVARNLVLAALLVARPIEHRIPDAASLTVAVVAGIALYIAVLIFNAIAALAASWPTRNQI